MFRIILFASMASVAAAQLCTDTLPTGTELAVDGCVMLQSTSFTCAIQCSSGFAGSSQGSPVDQIVANCADNAINAVDALQSDWECTATTAFVCNTTAFDGFTNHDTSACAATVRNVYIYILCTRVHLHTHT